MAFLSRPALMLTLLAAAFSLLAPAPVSSARERAVPPPASPVPTRNAAPAVVATPIRPDPRLTPGDTLDVTLADIQEKGYSAKVRNVPIAVKRQIYAAYGISQWRKGEYEVDHLIPLSLGGSNSTKNLWPQSYQNCVREPRSAQESD